MVFNDIHETTVYLEKFIRNLLLGENNELKNRYLHINHLFDENADKKAEINAEIKISEKQKKIILMLKENPYCTIKELSDKLDVNQSTVERNIKNYEKTELLKESVPKKTASGL